MSAATWPRRRNRFTYAVALASALSLVAFAHALPARAQPPATAPLAPPPTEPTGPTAPLSVPPVAPEQVPAPAPATPLAPAPAPPPPSAPPVAVTAIATATDGPLGFRLALAAEAAFGVTVGRFRNGLGGARLDYRFSPTVALGGYLGYANLKGPGGRTGSVLPLATLEYMATLGRDNWVRVPLRFSTGYLRSNGPVMRVAAGLAFALTPSVDLVTELFAPTVWVTRNQTLVSMDLALELAFRI